MRAQRCIPALLSRVRQQSGAPEQPSTLPRLPPARGYYEQRVVQQALSAPCGAPRAFPPRNRWCPRGPAACWRPRRRAPGNASGGGVSATKKTRCCGAGTHVEAVALGRRQLRVLGAQLRGLLEEKEDVAASNRGLHIQANASNQAMSASLEPSGARCIAITHRCTPLGGEGPLYCVSLRPFVGSAPPATSTTSQCSQLRNVCSHRRSTGAPRQPHARMMHSRGVRAERNAAVVLSSTHWLCGVRRIRVHEHEGVKCCAVQ